jgi:hypothetical protein
MIELVAAAEGRAASYERGYRSGDSEVEDAKRAVRQAALAPDQHCPVCHEEQWPAQPGRPCATCGAPEPDRAAPPQEGEREPCPKCGTTGIAMYSDEIGDYYLDACDRCRRRAAPTPDREALRERVDDILGFLDTVPLDVAFGPRERQARRYIKRLADALASLPGGREQERLYCGFPPCDFWCHADTAPYFDNCPKCLGSFSFARPRRRPTAAPQASADTQRIDWLEAQAACNIDRMGTDAPYWNVYGEHGSGVSARLRDAIDDAMDHEAKRASADTGERA